jgi:hypothetical protein
VNRTDLVRCIAIAVVFAAAAPRAGAVTVTTAGGNTIITNGVMTLTVNLSAGTWTGTLDGGHTLNNVGLRVNNTLISGYGAPAEQDLNDSIGTGKQLTFTGSNGTMTMRVYDNEPFFTVNAQRAGSSGQTMQISGELNTGTPRTDVMVWYQDPNYWTAKHRPRVIRLTGTRTSIFNICAQDIGTIANAVYDRPGIIVGSVGIEARDQQTQVTPTAGGMSFQGTCQMNPSNVGQTFAVFATRDVPRGMERYGDLVRVISNVAISTWVPSGFCTWDAFGNGITEADVRQVADSLVHPNFRLKDYGYTLVQIDDGWQVGYRCSGSWWANTKFSGSGLGESQIPSNQPYDPARVGTDNNGMRTIADYIRARGLQAGIWIGPHNDEDGFANSWWKQTPMGLQNPSFSNPTPTSGMQRYELYNSGFQTWLANLFARITNTGSGGWAYDYIKLDFVNQGNGTMNDFRNAFFIMVNNMRPGTMLLQCNSYPWVCINAGQAMRTGEDTGVDFRLDRLDYNIVANILATYQWYTNKRLWITDIDMVHVESRLTIGQSRIWAGLTGLSGGLVLLSDRFWDTGVVPANRLQLIKDIAPSCGGYGMYAARPADMFEHPTGAGMSVSGDYAELYVLDVPKPWGTWYIVQAINYRTTAQNKVIDFAKRIGLSPTQDVIVYDFWGNQCLGTFTGSVTVSIPAQDTRILAVVPKLTVPQIVSTNRHITQGGVDLLHVSWNAGTRVLSGTSQCLVTGVPYTMALNIPAGFTLQSATMGGQTMTVTPGADGVTRVTWTNPNATSASWSLNFTSGGTGDVTPPAAVGDLAQVSVTTHSVTVRWTAPGDDGTVGTAAAYDLRRHTAMITEGNWASITPCIGVPAPQPAGTQQQYTQTGLNPGTSYYFALKTRDEVPNESALSNVLVVRTAEVQIDTTPPAAVMNLVASSPSLTSLRLTWTAPGARGTVGTAASYDIRYALNAITNLSQFAAATPCPGIPTPLPAGSQQTFIVQGLTAGTTYFFALRTTNADGYTSDLSNSPSGATLLSSDVTPPAQITTLAVTASSNTTVSLRWTAPGDDGTIGTATTYDIRYALGVITSTSFATATQCSGAPVPAAAGTQQTYTVTGLAPGGVRYYFALRTADESGNWSAISNVVTTATVNRPPAVNIAGPENGAVFPTGSGVIFTITAEDPDGSVQGIQLYRTTGTYTVMVGSSSGGSYNPNILFNDPGVFQMVARATDLNGAVGWSSTVTISITALPICGITSPTDQAVIYTTAPTATLTIVATATVASGAIERVEFYHGTTLLFTDSAAPYLYDWMNVPVGSYNLSVRAYANGQSANSLGVTVHVAALAPTCAITAPADHTTFATSTGATVVITAHADIPVGSIQRVEFYAGTTLLGVDSSSPYTFTWTAVMPGTYVLTARAFTASQSAVSAGVTIVVGAGGSSPGTVTVPPGDVRAFGGTEGYVRPDDGDVVRLFVNPRRTGTVSIRIHALTGALVREFTVQVAANVTAHQLWDCTDASGAIVPSGVYIVDVAGAGLKLRRKVAVVR